MSEIIEAYTKENRPKIMCTTGSHDWRNGSINNGHYFGGLYGYGEESSFLSYDINYTDETIDYLANVKNTIGRDDYE